MHRPLARLLLRTPRTNHSPPDKLLTAPNDLDPFRRDHGRLDDAVSRDINTDPDNVEQGLAQLVLTVIELLRQLMERQALRRVQAGGLDDETIERLGATLMALETRMNELKRTFNLRDEDLNLDLGAWVANGPEPVSGRFPETKSQAGVAPRAGDGLYGPRC